MTIEQLRAALQAIVDRQRQQEQDRRDGQRRFGPDIERDHEEADELLVSFIGDDDVSRLFEEISRWYA